MKKLDVEAVDEMAPTAKKAGHTVEGVRDIVHPGLVSDMLMAILASVGESVPARQIHKRIPKGSSYSGTAFPRANTTKFSTRNSKLSMRLEKSNTQEGAPAN